MSPITSCGQYSARSGAVSRPRDAVVIWVVNHVFDEAWQNETLTQVVLYRFYEHDGTADYYVADWEHARNCVGPWLERGKWIGWFRGTRIEAALCCEVWTNYDIEVYDRRRLDTDKRRKIEGVRK